MDPAWRHKFFTPAKNFTKHVRRNPTELEIWSVGGSHILELNSTRIEQQWLLDVSCSITIWKTHVLNNFIYLEVEVGRAYFFELSLKHSK